jgi:hypothetical protein
MNRTLLLISAGCVCAWAQYRGRDGIRYIDDGQTFQIRRTNDYSENRRDGRCRVRVRIDDEADVELRGDTIRIHVIKGGPGKDEGTECNAPLPTSGNITNFRFRGIDGRGTPRLVQEPASRNSYVAVVNIQDPRGGSEGFTYELTWNWDGQGGGSGGSGGSGGGGFFPGGPSDQSAIERACLAELRNRVGREQRVSVQSLFDTRRETARGGRDILAGSMNLLRNQQRETATFRCTFYARDNRVEDVTYDMGSSGGSGGGFFPGGPSGLPDMNVSTMGSGQLYDGSNRYQLQEIGVRIRDGACNIRLISANGQTVEMNGNTVSGRNECQLNSATNGRLNATARFQMNGNRIGSMQMNGTLNGRTFNADFNPR